MPTAIAVSVVIVFDPIFLAKITGKERKMEKPIMVLNKMSSGKEPAVMAYRLEVMRISS
jgi:hypothetical protein